MHIAASKIEKIIPAQKLRVKEMTASKSKENMNNKDMLLRNKKPKNEIIKADDIISDEKMLVIDNSLLVVTKELVNVEKNIVKTINLDVSKDLFEKKDNLLQFENDSKNIGIPMKISDLMKSKKESVDNSINIDSNDIILNQNVNIKNDISIENIFPIVAVQESDSNSNSLLASFNQEDNEFNIIKETMKIILEETQKKENEMVRNRLK